MFDDTYPAILPATHDITKSFGTVKAPAGISLIIISGESVIVMRSSDSGKSTLLHCLSGVLIPNDGRVLFTDEDLTEISDAQRFHLYLSRFGFVLQDGRLIPELLAREGAVLPLLLTDTWRRTTLVEADEVLAKIGIPDLADRRPFDMLNGQTQRVAIARVLAANLRVVFADESNDALSQTTNRGVMQLLTATVVQAGVSLMMVTHDPAAARWCSRLMEIRDGLIHIDRRPGVEVTQ